ncbi:MAG: molybdopterin molybdenumtransferase MoeA [Phycisphaeraceae bacterium]|nr:molybdopterin molybdenumtransferase MoeA [Phycisphaeraceae bacterium]
MKPDLPGYDEALERVLAGVPAPVPETVDLDVARGRVLLESIKADRDQPPFDRSAMDGFAVRSDEVAPDRTFAVTGTLSAGAPQADMSSRPMTVMRIATGCPVPRGADAVIPREQAVTSEDQGTEKVRFDVAEAGSRRNVHPRASDATAGQVVVETGTRLAPQHLAVAATMGRVRLAVAPRPHVKLLTSGDEVRPSSTSSDRLEDHQIRNSNGPMLRAWFDALGHPLDLHEHVPDDEAATLAAARAALERSDLVVTVGGVSAGHRDLLPWAWSELGLETIVHGVAIQPGKPILVATGDGRMVVGLPGNPVSALVTAHLFLWPALRKRSGLDPTLPWRPRPLAEATTANPKRQLFRCARDREDGAAAAIAWHGSGDLVHTRDAEGLVRLPVTEGAVAAGTMVPYLPFVG